MTSLQTQNSVTLSLILALQNFSQNMPQKTISSELFNDTLMGIFFIQKKNDLTLTTYLRKMLSCVESYMDDILNLNDIDGNGKNIVNIDVNNPKGLIDVDELKKLSEYIVPLLLEGVNISETQVRLSRMFKLGYEYINQNSVKCTIKSANDFALCLFTINFISKILQGLKFFDINQEQFSKQIALAKVVNFLANATISQFIQMSMSGIMASIGKVVTKVKGCFFCCSSKKISEESLDDVISLIKKV